MLVIVPVSIIITSIAIAFYAMGVSSYYDLYKECYDKKRFLHIMLDGVLGTISLCIGFLFSVLAYNIMMSL